MNEMNKFRTTARIVGAVYLGGFVVSLLGNGLVQSILGAPDLLSTVSANSMKLAIGSMFWLIAVVGDGAHGVLMFPVLKQHSERIAVGYLAARIVDAVFIAIMILFILLQIPLGSQFVKAVSHDDLYLQGLSTVSVQASQYAYQIAMIAVGIAGSMLCYTFYSTKLIPRFLAIWGFAGYAIIFCGMMSEVLGSGLGLVSSIPGGLWELFTGVWLIVKGFNSSSFISESAKKNINQR